MKLYYTRHGETVWNHRDVVCGRTDIPLTEKGQQQALELAAQAEAAGIDVIIASPLIRAQQTAQAVSDRIGVPILTEPLLIEQCFGDFEGCDRHNPQYLDYKRNFFRRFPGGGESLVMVAQRAYSLIEKVKREHAGHTVLLVGHGAFGRVFRTWFLDTPNAQFDQWYLKNCQMVEFELEE
ncbi:MAG: histidine phosphatase family protein [Oscillospiraceae bacterium]|nr:histidine phosphatase family protein [Oscillospiraceae bacterium]